MNKRELLDSLEHFSQQLMLTLAEVEAIKHDLQEVFRDNHELKLENDKLRERLAELEPAPETQTLPAGMSSLESIYDEGFHVCNDKETRLFGKRREADEPCLFCLELLDRK